MEFQNINNTGVLGLLIGCIYFSYKIYTCGWNTGTAVNEVVIEEVVAPIAPITGKIPEVGVDFNVINIPIKGIDLVPIAKPSIINEVANINENISVNLETTGVVLSTINENILLYVNPLIEINRFYCNYLLINSNICIFIKKIIIFVANHYDMIYYAFCDKYNLLNSLNVIQDKFLFIKTLYDLKGEERLFKGILNSFGNNYDPLYIKLIETCFELKNISYFDLFINGGVL